MIVEAVINPRSEVYDYDGCGDAVGLDQNDTDLIRSFSVGGAHGQDAHETVGQTHLIDTLKLLDGPSRWH